MYYKYRLLYGKGRLFFPGNLTNRESSTHNCHAVFIAKIMTSPNSVSESSIGRKKAQTLGSFLCSQAKPLAKPLSLKLSFVNCILTTIQDQ